MDEAAAATARSRGHRVVTGRFEVDDELEHGTFDLILALHVIEHVDDPERFARRAAELLAPGGVFAVATPNWDSRDARRFRGVGRQPLPPPLDALRPADARGPCALDRAGDRPDRVPAEPDLLGVDVPRLAARRFPGGAGPTPRSRRCGSSTPRRGASCCWPLHLIDALQRGITGRTASIAIQLRRNERRVRAAPRIAGVRVRAEAMLSRLAGREVGRRELYLLGAALGVGVVLRLTFVLTRDHFLVGDEALYDRQVRLMLEGKLFYELQPTLELHATRSSRPATRCS